MTTYDTPEPLLRRATSPWRHSEVAYAAIHSFMNGMAVYVVAYAGRRSSLLSDAEPSAHIRGWFGYLLFSSVGLSPYLRIARRVLELKRHRDIDTIMVWRLAAPLALCMGSAWLGSVGGWWMCEMAWRDMGVG